MGKKHSDNPEIKSHYCFKSISINEILTSSHSKKITLGDCTTHVDRSSRQRKPCDIPKEMANIT